MASCRHSLSNANILYLKLVCALYLIASICLTIVGSILLAKSKADPSDRDRNRHFGNGLPIFIVGVSLLITAGCSVCCAYIQAAVTRVEIPYEVAQQGPPPPQPLYPPPEVYPPLLQNGSALPPLPSAPPPYPPAGPFAMPYPDAPPSYSAVVTGAPSAPLEVKQPMYPV